MYAFVYACGCVASSYSTRLYSSQTNFVHFTTAFSYHRYTEPRYSHAKQTCGFFVNWSQHRCL